MKSRVFSVALLSAMAAMASSQASATNVELYGVVDYGMSIQNRSYADDSSATVTAMKTGQYLGPRFGLKGTEDLGNGVKLGFVLESGFDGDTGMMGQGGRLFGRDARLYFWLSLLRSYGSCRWWQWSLCSFWSFDEPVLLWLGRRWWHAPVDGFGLSVRG